MAPRLKTKRYQKPTSAVANLDFRMMAEEVWVKFPDHPSAFISHSDMLIALTCSSLQ